MSWNMFLVMSVGLNGCHCQFFKVIFGFQVDIVEGDLSMCLKSAGLIDLLVFNPPYVVTSDDEICGTLQRAWAGGTKGRVVIDR